MSKFWTKNIKIGVIDYAESNRSISNKIGAWPTEIERDRASFRTLARSQSISVGHRPILFELAPLDSAWPITPIQTCFGQIFDTCVTVKSNHFHFQLHMSNLIIFLVKTISIERIGHADSNSVCFENIR